MIHPTAIISPDAKIGPDVQIGPFSVIGANVELGAGCILHSHVVIEGTSSIGEKNEFFPFTLIGGRTQDMKYAGEPTRLEIGDRNVFREGSTIHRGTFDHTPTRIGNDNLFLIDSHVAHECQLGDHIILSNNATLAGHITVEDYVIVSGLSAIHQFCKVGCHSIIGGCSRVTHDVPPYMIVEGHPAVTRGINLIGLQRRGFTTDDLRALKSAYKKLFLKREVNMKAALSSLRAEAPSNNPHVKHLLAFVESSERGVGR